jgi:hypothetical protein
LEEKVPNRSLLQLLRQVRRIMSIWRVSFFKYSSFRSDFHFITAASTTLGLIFSPWSELDSML